MKNCFACGNVQDTGNFCAKCGGRLTDTAASNDGGSPTQTPNQPPGQPIRSTQNNQQPEQTQQGASPYLQQPFQQQGNPFQQQGGPNQFQQPGHPSQQQGQFQQQGNPYQQQAPQQPNVHVEKVKNQSKMYFSYFAEHLKRPSTIFGRGENEFVNGIITLIAYAIIFGLTLFFLASSTSFYYNISSYFFQIFGGGALVIIILSALVIVSLFVINKLFGPDYSFKEIISNFGALIIPSLLLMVVVFVLFLVRAYDFGFILLAVSLLIAIVGVPLYIISRLLGIRSKSIDAFYAYLLYIILFMFLYYIVNLIVIDNTVGRYLYYGW